MATVPLVQYEDAPREVKDIFDDIMRTRQCQELLAVVATAHMTNALANGFKIPVDDRFKRTE